MVIGGLGFSYEMASFRHLFPQLFPQCFVSKGRAESS